MKGIPRAWHPEQHIDGRVTLWLDRPGGPHNILDSPTFLELEEVLERPDIRSARLLVVRSRKPRGFCAGADLKELAKCTGAKEAEAYMRRGWSALKALMGLPMPTVADVHGVCLGGGLELALACRARWVREGEDLAPAQLGAPEVTHGLVPSWGAISALPRLIGLDAALTVLLGGPLLGANEALALGLADLRLSETTQPSTAEFELRHREVPWPPPDWPEALERTRRSLPKEDDGPNLARRRLLDVLEKDCEFGFDRAQEAAMVGLSELAVSPAGRTLLDAFAKKRPTSDSPT